MDAVNVINPIDRDSLKASFRSATPFPHVIIDRFLEPTVAEAIARSYPSFEAASRLGQSFQAVNERRKVQITDRAKFPDPVKALTDALSSPSFLDDLSYITGIKTLVWDDLLQGGGMHQTSSGGRLDVHVDFNWLKQRGLFRRLNILVYLNPVWDERWGGNIELWDAEVKVCHQSLAPALGRCVIFETSERSYHGVTPIAAPEEVSRKSFAAYYYTREPPRDWVGEEHTTIFRARPHEVMRGFVLMPAERMRGAAIDFVRTAKRRIRALIPG
jgi:hypothetical protein